LRNTGRKEQLLETQNAIVGEFQPDGEEKKDDPDLGDQLDFVEAFNQVKTVRAYEQTGGEIADDWRLTQEAEGVGIEQSETKEDKDVL
jgi:hypothetical protein